MRLLLIDTIKAAWQEIRKLHPKPGAEFAEGSVRSVTPDVFVEQDENGKYVVPAPLEELLQLSPFINQAFIDGHNRLFNVSLIVPDRLAVEKWAKGEGLKDDYEALLANPKTEALFKAQIEQYSKDFKSYERPKKFKLITEEFTVDNGMLTPKMSLKRKVVVERYGDLIEELHGA